MPKRLYSDISTLVHSKIKKDKYQPTHDSPDLTQHNPSICEQHN